MMKAGIKILAGFIVLSSYILAPCRFFAIPPTEKSQLSFDSEQYAHNELIIRFKIPLKINLASSTFITDVPQLDSLNSLYRLEEIIPLFRKERNNGKTLDRCYLFRFSQFKAPARIKQSYEKLGIVEWVEYNYYYYAEPQLDAAIARPLEDLMVYRLSGLSNKYPVVIAVIDAGVDWAYLNLSDKLWRNRFEKADGKDNDGNGLVDDLWGWNFVPKEIMARYGIKWVSRPIDESGHGTALAEIIKQTPMASSRGDGSVNRCEIMVLKAGLFNQEGKILVPAAAAAQAIVYAANQGAQLICLSWASEDSSRLLHQAIRYAASRNVVMIAAAGDHRSLAPVYPAAFPEVWAITATDELDHKVPSANFGHWIDLAAPDQPFAGIAVPESIHFWPSPTAIAAANVTSLAALLLSAEKITKTDSLKKRILWSSDNIYLKNPGYRGLIGAGRINIYRAIHSKFLPNIIIQQIQFELPGETDRQSNDLIIPTWVKIKNLASTARQVNIQLTSHDPLVNILNSKITIPLLAFNQEFDNKAAPMILMVDRSCPPGYKARLAIDITSDEGFRYEQDYSFINRIISPPTLTIDNSYPPSLHWTGDPEFAGYFIYRKEAKQRSFRKIYQSLRSDTIFIDNGIIPNRGYWYYVSAVDSMGQEIAQSNAVSFHPDQESLFRFYPTQDTAICKNDSICFSVTPVDSEKYSYQWLVNGKPISNNSNRIVFRSYQFGHEGSDTVAVKIRGEEGDTTLSHSWILSLRKIYRSVAFVAASPSSDTTITAGDTLKCYVQVRSTLDDSLRFRWRVNERIREGICAPWILLHSDSLLPGKNIISVTIIAEDTSLGYQWTIELTPTRLNLNHLLFLPQSDTTIAPGDTLILSAVADSSLNQKLRWRWFINGRYDSSAVAPDYRFTKPNQATAPDTIKVEIIDHDFTVSHIWIVRTRQRSNRAPQIRFCWPPLDSLLTQCDSLLFNVRCHDPDDDSLRYFWSLNGIEYRQARQHHYLYRCSPNRATIDTLVLRIADADTAISVRWILWPNPLQPIPKGSSIQWQPQDTLLACSDTLIFRVNNAGNCRFQWQVNRQIDSLARDSLFVYHSSLSGHDVDTIEVRLWAIDGELFHRWYVQKQKSAVARPLRLEFYPAQETVSMTPPDSIILSVSVLEGDRTELQFQWSTTQQHPAVERDTSFCYHLKSFKVLADTIWLTVVGPDTAIVHYWVIRSIQQTLLLSPYLIFPVKGGRIHEEDTFIWENDSLLSSEIDLAKCRYVIQVSSDSSFSKWICSDTCRSKAIKLNQLTGFDRISIGRPFFWRVKILTDHGQSSEFRRCALACTYYPQFAQISAFYGRINSDATIDIFWIASYEDNCAGFHLYRSESPNNDFTRINDQLIVGQENYSYQDKTADPGKTYFYKLEQVTVTGKKKFHGLISLTAPKPEKLILWQNYPNPFNTQTSIRYEVPFDCQVKIVISNVLGRKIKTLVDEFHKSGFYTIYWNGRDDLGENAVSGIYFYTLITPTERLTRKMVIAR